MPAYYGPSMSHEDWQLFWVVAPRQWIPTQSLKAMADFFEEQRKKYGDDAICSLSTGGQFCCIAHEDFEQSKKHHATLEREKEAAREVAAVERRRKKFEQLKKEFGDEQ